MEQKERGKEENCKGMKLKQKNVGGCESKEKYRTKTVGETGIKGEGKRRCVKERGQTPRQGQRTD